MAVESTDGLLFVVNDLEDISLNRAVLTLIRKIYKSKFRVCLISLSSRGSLSKFFHDLNEVELIFSGNIIEGLARVSKYFFSHASLVIHTQTLRADFTVFLSRLVAFFSHSSITHICVRRNYLFSKEKFWHRIKNLFYFLSCHLADLNVCVAQHLEKKLVSGLRVPQTQVITIVNGIDFKEKFPSNRSKRAQLIIFTGRLIPRKNVMTLLQAMKNISSAWKCLIVGDGENSVDLNNYCRISGIQDRVKFLGHKTNVVLYLSKADIFVLPSLDEGLSWSLLEAMSCGLACVVSDADGNVELINNGYNGLVFKLRDGAAGLAKCLRQLIADTKLRRRLGTNARKTVRENYSESAMITAYENLYLRLANFDRATSAVTPAR